MTSASNSTRSIDPNGPPCPSLGKRPKFPNQTRSISTESRDACSNSVENVHWLPASTAARDPQWARPCEFEHAPVDSDFSYRIHWRNFGRLPRLGRCASSGSDPLTAQPQERPRREFWQASEVPPLNPVGKVGIHGRMLKLARASPLGVACGRGGRQPMDRGRQPMDIFDRV